MKTVLEEMWAVLAAYQPQADATGHGESWERMCREKTASAAGTAAYAASVADDDAAYAAYAASVADDTYAKYATYAAYAPSAGYASSAAFYAEVAAEQSQKAIKRINRLMPKSSNPN